MGHAMRIVMAVGCWMILGIGLAYGVSSYTGYSGASGSNGTCASSCHGSGVGTITVTGLPSSYVPGTTYRIVIGHKGGSTIRNFNASSRVGSTTTVAGSFTAVTNASLYSVSAETGVHASTNSIDSCVFQWKAPAAGTGAVKFHVAGLQGTKSGPNTALVVTMTESAVNAVTAPLVPATHDLLENYPNPFNPATTLTFMPGARDRYTLKVYDVLGREIVTLFDDETTAGASYTVQFNAAGRASGTYVAVLRSGTISSVKKLLLSK